MDSKGMKMDVVLTENDNIMFSIYDLLYAMGDEAKKRMGTYLACEDEIWQEITRQVIEEYASPNMDTRIHNLRLAFMTSNQFPQDAATVIKHLVNEIVKLKKDNSLLQKAVYSWTSWFDDHFPESRFNKRPIQVEESDLIHVKDSVILSLLESLGIDFLEIQNNFNEEE